METEQELMQEIVNEVADKVGQPRLPVEILDRNQAGEVNLAAIYRRHRFVAIGYTQDITRHFDAKMLAAIVAHEYGHIASQGRASEAQADQFAAIHGYAEDSIRAFQRLEEETYPDYSRSSTHPPESDRVKFFQSYLQSKTMGAGQ